MGTHQTHIFSESTRRADSEYIYIYGLILKKRHVASCGLANSKKFHQIYNDKTRQHNFKNEKNFLFFASSQLILIFLLF